jgi:hypothetical protein
MNMALAQAVATRKRETSSEPALPARRVLISASVDGIPDEASRDRIRRLFHSPLGVYVSQASRNHESLHLEFDVAAIDLDFTLRTLQEVLPEAEIESIRPRVFSHRKH